jgi:transcriptional regulator of acetoin/glycerol metabolism
MQALEAYHWPGNIRQLFNSLDRAQIMADDQCIRLVDLPREIVNAPRTDPEVLRSAEGTDNLAHVQRSHVQEVLARERGNKARAAKVLGINRRSLYRLLEKYGIESAESETASEAAENPGLYN